MNNRAGLTGVALLGALMGLFAIIGPTLAKSVVCFHSQFAQGKSCSDLAETEGKLLGTFLALLVAGLASCIDHERGRTNAKKTVAVIWAAVVAAFALVLEAMVDQSFRDNSGGATLFLSSVLLVILVLPLSLKPESYGAAQIAQVYGRLFAVMMAATVIAAIVQIVGEVIWVGFGPGWTAKKFIVAPSGTVIIGAAWVVLCLEPSADKAYSKSRRRLWVTVFVALAIIISAAYGARFGIEHFLVPGATAQILAAALVVGLALPGIIAGLLTLELPFERTQISWPGLAASAAIAIATGAFAWLAADHVRVDAESAVIAAVLRARVAFAVSHGLAAAGILCSVVVGLRALAFSLRRIPDWV